MGVLVVRVGAQEAEAATDWLFQLGATAIEDRSGDDEPTLVAGFLNDDQALYARSILNERWPCRFEDTGDERAWRDKWLEHLEPIDVAGFHIHAPWHEVTTDAEPLSIDPGAAFGSGHHPTTQLALVALRDTVRSEDRVLDVGCGTGILSIATAKLGAGSITGIDLDHDIIAVAQANAEANGVAAQVDLHGDRLEDLTESFDVVVANIVIGHLAPLMTHLAKRCERKLIVTGYLPEQFEKLLTNIDVHVVERRRQDDWECAVLQIP